MLTTDQIEQVWQNRLAAETRSYYFGDLAAYYSRQKQWITGASFFLSSGAAAALGAKSPAWVPLLLAVLVAVLNAYSMSVRLDAKVSAMGKLYREWGQIAMEYGQLWNTTWAENASAELSAIQIKELEVSGLSVVEAPYDVRRLSKWQEQVFQIHGLAASV